MALSNPFIDDDTPIFTFPPPPPPPRSKEQAAALPPERKSPALRVIGIIGVFGFVALVVGFIVLAVSQNDLRQAGAQPPLTKPSQMESSRGMRQLACPSDMRNYSTCWGLNLPANGQWVRWVTPTSKPFGIPNYVGVIARGCNGEIYELAKGGNRFNASCGHMDYRTTDGDARFIVIGANE